MNCGWAFFLALGPHVRALGANEAEVGAFVGCFGVAGICAIPLLGPLIARLGYRAVLVSGGLCAAGGSLAFVLSEGLSSWLYAARLLQGLGFSLFTNALLTLLGDQVSQSRRASAVGTLTLCGTLSLVLCPPIAERIADSTGSYVAAFGLGTASALAGSLVAALIPVPMWARWTAPRGRDPARRDPGWRVVLILAFTHAVAYGVLFGFVPVYVRDLGGSFADFFVVYTLVLLVVRTLGVRLVRRAHGSGAFGALLAVSAGAVAVLSPGAAGWPFLLSAGLFGVSHGILYPALSARALAAVHPADRAYAVARFSFSFAVGAYLAVIPLGVLASRVGYASMFALTAGLLVATAGATIAWGPRAVSRADRHVHV